MLGDRAQRDEWCKGRELRSTEQRLRVAKLYRIHWAARASGSAGRRRELEHCDRPYQCGELIRKVAGRASLGWLAEESSAAHHSSAQLASSGQDPGRSIANAPPSQKLLPPCSALSCSKHRLGRLRRRGTRHGTCHHINRLRAPLFSAARDTAAGDETKPGRRM